MSGHVRIFSIPPVPRGDEFAFDALAVGDESPVASGPGDESPVASGPGDESPVASGPGDELTLKLDLTEADDGFAFDRLGTGDTAPDPSDGSLPMESLRPADTSYASSYALYQDVYVPVEPTGADGGSDIRPEGITIVHEGFELV
jgi:hypothetical protein